MPGKLTVITNSLIGSFVYLYLTSFGLGFEYIEDTVFFNENMRYKIIEFEICEILRIF